MAEQNGVGSKAPTQQQLAIADKLRNAAEHSAQVAEENAKRAAESVEAALEKGEKLLKIFYARISGMTHIFKDGTVARFINGEYHARFAHEIEELEALCRHPFNHLISDKPVPLQNPEGVTILREVPQSGTGMVSSMNLGGAAQQQ